MDTHIVHACLAPDPNQSNHTSPKIVATPSAITLQSLLKRPKCGFILTDNKRTSRYNYISFRRDEPGYEHINKNRGAVYIGSKYRTFFVFLFNFYHCSPHEVWPISSAASISTLEK